MTRRAATLAGIALVGITGAPALDRDAGKPISSRSNVAPWYARHAPVAAPPNGASTLRGPGMRSSAATKCISEVPGLGPHTSTPHPPTVSSRGHGEASGAGGGQPTSTRAR